MIKVVVIDCFTSVCEFIIGVILIWWLIPLQLLKIKRCINKCLTASFESQLAVMAVTSFDGLLMTHNSCVADSLSILSRWQYDVMACLIH